MPGGGTLNSGRVLRPPSRSSGPLPVLVDPDGRELVTMVPSPSAAHVFEVVKTSIATGRVVSVLGSRRLVPDDLVAGSRGSSPA